MKRNVLGMGVVLVLAVLMAQGAYAQQAWLEVDAGATADLNSVSYPEINYTWIGDADGNVWVSLDGGSTWSNQMSFTGNINGVSFADEEFGTVATQGGSIYSTENGGLDWTTVQEGFLLSFYAVHTIPDTEVSFVAGQNTIFQPYIQWTEDGWQTDDAMAFYIDINNVGNEGSIQSLFGFDVNTMVAGCRVFDGTGAITRTDDAGATWTTTWTGDFPVMGVDFTNELLGAAVTGDGTILRTDDGGMTWTEVVDGAGTALNDVDWANDDFVWAVGNGGTIMKSVDGGMTWTDDPSPVGLNLNSVDMISSNAGVAVGEAGTVLVYGDEPVPATLDLQPTLTEVPAEGGIVYYDVAFESELPNTIPNMRYWTMAETPGGNTYGPLFSQYFTHVPMMTVNVTGLEQNVPAMAPSGTYTYYGFVGLFPSPAIMDSFEFTKLAAAAAAAGDPVNDWSTSGRFVATNEAGVTASALPSDYAISEAYPNPFNPSTTMSVALPQASELTVQVFDVTGREVAELANGRYSAGEHTLTFDASSLASGIYFIQATVPGELNQVRKVTLMK